MQKRKLAAVCAAALLLGLGTSIVHAGNNNDQGNNGNHGNGNNANGNGNNGNNGNGNNGNGNGNSGTPAGCVEGQGQVTLQNPNC